MSQKTKKTDKQKNTPLVFNFGDPKPVLNSGSLALGELELTGAYYDTPFSAGGLAKILHSNPYHGSIIECKTNLFMRGFIHNSVLSRSALHAAVTDYNVFANAYFLKIKNSYKEIINLLHVPAVTVRRMEKEKQYAKIKGFDFTPFKVGDIIHIKNYAVAQSIYGVPFYLGAIQSMLLNEDSTLFRRKYYQNGAHMGYILSTTGNLNQEQQTAITDALKESKGAGNFRNMYVHIPESGRHENIKIHPVGDFSTRDELEKIKNLTRDDIFGAHRLPPALMSVIPQNTGGFGDLDKIDRTYKKNEIEPIRQLFYDINNLFDTDVIQFKEPEENTE